MKTDHDNAIVFVGLPARDIPRTLTLSTETRGYQETLSRWLKDQHTQGRPVDIRLVCAPVKKHVDIETRHFDEEGETYHSNVVFIPTIVGANYSNICIGVREMNFSKYEPRAIM
jgi:hypothetical protein